MTPSETTTPPSATAATAAAPVDSERRHMKAQLGTGLPGKQSGDKEKYFVRFFSKFFLNDLCFHLIWPWWNNTCFSETTTRSRWMKSASKKQLVKTRSLWRIPSTLKTAKTSRTRFKRPAQSSLWRDVIISRCMCKAVWLRKWLKCGNAITCMFKSVPF